MVIWIFISTTIIFFILSVVGWALVWRSYKTIPEIFRKSTEIEQQEFNKIKENFSKDLYHVQQETATLVNRAIGGVGQALVNSQNQISHELGVRQQQSQQSILEHLRNMTQQLQGATLHSQQQLEQIRQTVERQLQTIQLENTQKLEQMRQTVDEKLQQTLESRLGQSFRLVETQLEQVQRGLGEMQALAAGVGDLKKVLSNVKTRGILGEVQLGAILEEILAPEQYLKNVVTKKGSRNPVEYAVVMPGQNEPVLLPIDAKFPADAYFQLTQAYEQGDAAAISSATAVLSARIKAFAKDIRDKYLDPPHTTDFAILFLPFEGLYAQVLQLGLWETLQREYHISIAGPTTMAALLNALQMGFQSLIIQRRSTEVWQVLGEVRAEFERFGEVLGAAQQRIQQAGSELDKLVGVRSRAIQRRLAQLGNLEVEMLTERKESNQK